MKRAWTRSWWARGMVGMLVTLAAGCGGDDPALGGGEAGSSGTTGDPMPPAALCTGGSPLAFGDAPWVKAPFTPPGDGMSDGDVDDGAGGDGWDGGGFLEDPDGGGVSFECDIWAQDCPAGEKCMAWANDGGSQWNATRCSPVASMPGMVGDPCMVEGGPHSGLDDCDHGAMCWDVDRANEGTCIGLCEGDESDPQCPPGQWCWVGYEGVVAVCMAEGLCLADGVCQCLCLTEPDPDCAPDQCIASEPPAPDELVAPLPVIFDEEDASCPETEDPVVLYMSNDDSNSQASPIIARRAIAEGLRVPSSRVRIHEFLNYFDLSGPSNSEAPATVGLEMRRTDEARGEFTLVLRAQGRRMAPDDRPPMNLVFSLDTSGSMSGEPIELLRETMAAAAGELRAGDVISVVTWDTAQAVELAGYAVTGPDDPELLGLIDGLHAGGGTDLHAGLVAAYQLANTYFMADGINRVVLVSDGGANAGVTDLDLIASEASSADGGGTYLVGVGVGSVEGYRDDLMDAVTDAGKGAYIFVDRAQEAKKQLGERFLANVAVSARNVQMKLTLPWYFGIKSFHGEEYSADPAEVEPQHLAPNDAMTFHQIISACDPSLITTCATITAEVEYVDPLTGAQERDEVTAALDTLVQQDAPRLYKADVVVGYAKALIIIDHLASDGKIDQARTVAQNMRAWAQEAADELGDAEVQDIAELMRAYAELL